MSLTDILTDLSVDYAVNEPMAAHTSFKTGGNAEVFIKPCGVKQLSDTLKACHALGLKPLVVGNGSNLLVPDEGLRRPVIDMAAFDSIALVESGVVRCGAGVSLARLCRFALEHALSGLEFAYGIPGSAGGAAYMNAGAYGGEMKDVLLSCSHLEPGGTAGTLCGEGLRLSYRHSAYAENGFVITDITVGLRSSSRAQIKEKMEELLGRRRDKQPLEFPSAGSVFKRPEGHFAGALIEQSGLKGACVGGAQVSEKHAGFIINRGGATTSDVLELISYCRKTVKEKTGVMLETEISLVEDC